MIERRTFGEKIEARAVQEGNIIVGYAAVFNRSTDLGWFTERIAPGAFRDSISSDNIVALVDHEPGRILGRNKAGTLRLVEDETGLRMEIDVADTVTGRDILTSVGRGDVEGASFGFQTLDADWSIQDGKDIRTLKRVKLFDVGPVTFPAYTDTSVARRAFDGWREQNGVAIPAEALQALGPAWERQHAALSRS